MNSEADLDSSPRVVRPTYAQRIDRAQDLAAKHPFASEILHFYACLAGKQEDLYDYFRTTDSKVAETSDAIAPLTTNRKSPDPKSTWPLDLELLVPRFSSFARVVEEWAPAVLGNRARHFVSSDVVEQTQLLSAFWNGGTYAHPADHFLALAFLQPYAEWLAETGHRIDQSAEAHASRLRLHPQLPTSANCPICSSEAIVAVHREQDLGARRSLVCSLCAHEWDFPRINCPACGEDRFESLAAYATNDIPHLRVDACDTCRHYIKTVDLTKDGHAIPIVDELAALPLDLWARDNNYKRIVPNLAGL